MTKQCVIYTDGGCKPSRGTGGWGVHGYAYVEEKPTKGSGCKGHFPTARGYVSNSLKATVDEVTILNYIDILGSLPPPATNNEAELTAMLETLRYIERESVMRAVILADSTYVIDGIQDYLPKWVRNGWLKQDGTEIANRLLWVEIHTALDRLKGSVSLEWQWVKGHSGDPGNDAADEWASKGIIVGRRNEVINVLTESPPTKYWSVEADNNPLLCQNRWMFTNHGSMADKTPDGEHFVYFTADLGANVEVSMYDKKSVDTSFSVLHLTAPDPVLEAVRTTQNTYRTRIVNGLFVGRLDNLLRPNFYTEVTRHGCQFVEQAGHKCDLYDYKYNQLTNEMVPLGQGLKAHELYEVMATQLTDIAQAAPHCKAVLTDITDRIYETTVTKKKTTVRISPTLDPNAREITVDVNYSLPSDKDQWTTGTIPVKLLFNNDLFKRNSLNNLSDVDTRVWVMTWVESPTAFRYGTVIQSKWGWSFTQSPYANIKLINKLA